MLRSVTPLGLVDLEIPGMDERPQGGLNGQPHPVRNAVGDPDKFNFKRTQFQGFFGRDQPQVRLSQKLMFFQFLPQQLQRKPGPVHRDREFPQQEGQRPDMVFMAMGQNHGPEPGLCALKES